MDLFKLKTEISVGIQKAVENLNVLGNKANDVAEKIQSGVAKQTEADINTNKAVNQLTKLNTTIQRQETELQLLKDKYTAVYLSQGKTSDEAKQLASQIDKLSGELKENKTKLSEASNAANQLDNNFNKVETSSKSLGGGFTVLKGAVANLIAQGFSKLIQFTSQFVSGAASYQSSMEQYTTSFEVMTGSASKAVEVTAELGRIAASTPFELTTLADATQLLMNYGFTADDAMVKMTMLGDISQGNADKMNRIAMAYGQMSSAGKVSLEDVKQMIEAGFNPLQEISQTTGESMTSLYDRISKGKISVDEITASMERSTAEGGKYFGSMDKQSQTLQGRLSTLKDTINASLGTALTGVLEKLSVTVIPAVTSAMEKVDWEAIGAKLGGIFEKLIELATWIIDNFELVSALIISIGTAFVTWKVVGIIQGIIVALKAWMIATQGMTVAQRLLNLAMSANPIGLIITAVAALVGAFIYLWNNVDGFRKFWQDVWKGITKVFDGVVNGIKNGIDKIKNFFNITLSFKGIKMPKISIEWSQSPKWMAEAAKFLGMQGVPKFGVKWNAKGAIFEEPTIFNTPIGMQGVAEAGKEIVAPLSELTSLIQPAVRSEMSGVENKINRLCNLVERFFPQVLSGMEKDVVLDSGVLVGQLAKQMDSKLGNIYERKERAK